MTAGGWVDVDDLVPYRPPVPYRSRPRRLRSKGYLPPLEELVAAMFVTICDTPFGPLPRLTAPPSRAARRHYWQGYGHTPAELAGDWMHGRLPCSERFVGLIEEQDSV